MNVAIISDYISGDFISGQAVFVNRLIKALARHVNKVLVVTSGKSTQIREDGNIKYYYLKGYPLKRFSGALLIPNPLPMQRELFAKEKIDIVHAHVPTIPAIAAIFSARRRSIPVVFSCHIQADNIIKNLNVSLPIFKKILNSYGVWFYNFADHVVCPSQHARLELFDAGLNKDKKVSVISNGINTEVFKPNGQSKPKILYVGRLMREKNVHTFIEASVLVKKAHPEFNFVVCGDGFMKGELEELAGKVNPHVIFTGRLNDQELLFMYQSCYAFVLPSEVEFQGIVLLEAMACGKPTIASDSSSSAAHELANLLFKNRDAADLARQINYLIENTQAAKRFSTENRERTIREHNFSKIVRKHLDIYKELIERNRKVH